MASNITLARDGSGSLFVAWASWTPGPDPAQPHVQASDIAIQLARWPAGASGFEAPVELSEAITASLYDKPWMIVTADDGIVVSYSDLSRGGIWVASSADGGAHFQRTLVDSTKANLAALCPDGRPGGAFVTYVATGAIRLAHTADGGLTWSSPVAGAVSDPSGNVAWQDPTCVASGDEAWIAYGGSQIQSGPFAGSTLDELVEKEAEVWLSYGRTHDGTDVPVERLLAIRVAHLTLGASSVDSDVIALDGASTALAIADGGGAGGDGGSAPGFLLFPQLAQFADGRLGLAAYRTAGEGTGAADLVYVVSTDGGRSFGNAITLATGLTPSLQRHVPDWLGDYFGWSPTAAGLGAAFIDNSSGFSHIVFDETVPTATP